jgi:hypothetical protein
VASSFDQFQRFIQQPQQQLSVANALALPPPSDTEPQFVARVFKNPLDSPLSNVTEDGSEDNGAISAESDNAAIAAAQAAEDAAAIAATANKNKTNLKHHLHHQFTDENEDNNTDQSGSSSAAYAELRRDEAALWSMLSANYAQCRAIEQQLSECHSRLQRHAAAQSAVATKRRRVNNAQPRRY